MPMLERSPRKEWHGEHPGVKLPYPTPPPTVHSAEGVIPPLSSTSPPLVVDETLKNLCIEDTEMVADKTPTLPVTKSEPCTPYRTTSPSCRGTSISYATPPRPSYRTVRGLPSAYVSEEGSSEKSPGKHKSLRKKVSSLWGSLSLRSKKSREALKDLPFY